MIKPKSKLKRRLLILVLIIVFVLTTILLYFNKVVNPIILSITESKVTSLSTKAVNSAVSEVLVENNLYEELVTICTNEAGDVVMIQANSILINKLSRDLARASQTKLETIGTQGISIPMGSFTGMPIFIGRGPEVRLKIMPIGAIQCSFLSEFVQAGINQTNHKIYVNLTSTLNVILPVSNKQIVSNTQLLICENIIVGKIPEVYLSTSGIKNLMDLIPT